MTQDVLTRCGRCRGPIGNGGVWMVGTLRVCKSCSDEIARENEYFGEEDENYLESILVALGVLVVAIGVVALMAWLVG